MEELNIILIILQNCNYFDLCLIYRCLNVKTFEKKECQNTFDMKLYTYQSQAYGYIFYSDSVTARVFEKS